MNEKCGLMNEKNPCRCALKTNAVIKTGVVNPDKVGNQSLKRIKDFVTKKRHVFENALEFKIKDLYRDHPLHASPDMEQVIGRILKNKL